MNIFWHELRTHRESLIIWALSLTSVSLLFIALYPAYTKDVQAIQEVFNNYPPALIKAFSIDLDIFFSFFGFYSYALSFVVMAGAIQSLNLGISMIAKESTDKTVDFLLSKPISRAKVITQKLLAALTVLAVTNGIFLTATYIAARLATDTLNTKIFLILSSSLFLVQLIFLALGMVISVTVKKVKNVVALSLPIVFGFYIVGAFESIFDTKVLQYLSPLKYFDPHYEIAHSAFELQFLAIALGLTIVGIIASYVLFNKKDISATI